LAYKAGILYFLKKVNESNDASYIDVKNAFKEAAKL
jgi:hypothetical protein